MTIPTEPFRKAVVIRLFRLWAVAREDGMIGLSRMHDIAAELLLPDETAPACASLFELIEAELGRSLVPECCCAQTYSADETALLGIIDAAPSLENIFASRKVPHGLPGAIRWAAMAVRRAMGWPQEAAPRANRANHATCPFDHRDLGGSLGA